MQKFLLILSLLPLICACQVKPSSKKPAPLIESITSDTIKGLCKKIVFEYDQLKRVSSITDKEIEIKTGNGAYEKMMKVQKFQYRDNEQIPYTRLVITYAYDDSTMFQDEELQFFLFKNGQRIGDSTIYLGTEQQIEDTKLADKNSTKRVAYFKQTPTKVIHILDLSEKNPTTYVPANIYADSFAIKKDHNIGFESTIHDEGNKFYPRAFFTFTEFDKAINPLHQLNIAPLLSNEKMTISYSEDEILQIVPSFDHNEGTELNWHYLNQNNPLKYSIERGETETPFKDIIQFSYTYNQYQQPIYCKATIKKVINKDPEHQYQRPIGTFKKSFTFRYKKD